MSPDQPAMHLRGSITLPSSPTVTTAWATYDWRGIATSNTPELVFDFDFSSAGPPPEGEQ